MSREQNLSDLREYLHSLMKDGVIKVTFIKNDGTERVMSCTLNESVIQSYSKKTEKVRKHNPDVMSVWDTEKSEWRSFRLDSVREVSFPLGYRYEST